MDAIGKELISLCKAHRNFLAARLAQMDLFPGQDGLLYHLSIKDGQTMSELVEKMDIQHATLFNMIERMARNGLVRKEKDETDQRTSRIYLTRQGMKLLEQLSQVWKEIEMQLRQNLSAMETNTFILIARKISGNLNRD
jgi:DNA-binding MarR family transcriptional regulator